MTEQKTITSQEQIEQIYGQLEKKIEVTTDIWKFAEDLLPPAPTDSQEEIIHEKDRFNELRQQAFDAFPDAIPLYKEYKELRDQILDLEDRISLDPEDEIDESNLHNLEVLHNKIKERNRILESPDINFLVRIDHGIFEMSYRRDWVRTIFSVAGEDYLDPSLYRERVPSGYENLNLVKIVPCRFSVGLVTDSSREWRKQKPTAYAFHLRGTPWNFVLENHPEVVKKIKKQSIMSFAFGHSVSAEELRDIILGNFFLHEDIHSAIEGFGFLDSLDPAKILSSRLHRLKDLQDVGASSEVLEQQIDVIKQQLSTFIDNFHEEIVVEIGGQLLGGFELSRSRLFKLKELFDIIKSSKEKVLEEINGLDIEGEHELLAIMGKTDAYDVLQKINQLTLRVSLLTPYKGKEFLAALTIFPPSKLRHVERLVDRWIKAEKMKT